MSSLTKVRTVVFDIGEVLIKLDFSKVMEARGLKPNQSLGQWLKEMNQWDLYDSFERGTVREKEFIEKLGVTEEAFLPMWNSVLVCTVPGIEQILQTLKVTVPLYALTNSNETHMRHCHAHFPVLKHFQRTLTSFDLRARKPEPEIYLKTQQEIGFSASEILFIDDRVENVEGAKKVGWSAELCRQSPADIRLILNRYGFPSG